MCFIFDKLAPFPQINVSKYALNHFWVYFRVKDSFRSAKNVVFSLFCFMVCRQWGAIAPALLATLLPPQILKPKIREFQILHTECLDVTISENIGLESL